MIKDENSNLRHLVTHERQDDRHKTKGLWRHWTSAGAFELKSDWKAGILIYELYFAGQLIDTYLHISTAIADVLIGDKNEKMGIHGQTCGLPPSINQWNGWK